INSNKFQWTHEDRIVGVPETQRDATFSPEQVFALHIPHLSDHTGGRLREEGISPGYLLQFHDTDVTDLYPSSTDWRRLFAWTPQITSTIRYNTKLAQPEGYVDSLANRLPMIRLPELYLISAEASLDTDPAKSRAHINELRQHRECDITIPDGVTDPAILRAEILLEYRREFISEGLLFYYYKRLDADQVEGVAGNYDKTLYVLPIPLEEIEFGNRF
ncbi:MAG: RagB/SusD family nutrient uptake outer membrane protein, partial [Odoribacteraceae bacterium]|nr:RagB/SusD family nutrient uptake outer membrane protein [Odoribacteraceae bacterium]